MKIAIGIVVFAVVLLSLVLLLPFLVDLNKYQDQYRPLIEDALNRKIQLQDIRLTVWPRLGARVAGFTLQDDPAFSREPFATLASLDVGVKLLPLLSGKVEVEEITLRDPVITVIKTKTGVMNISTIGPQGSPQPTIPQGPAEPGGSPLQALALLAVDRVSITGGTVTYRDLSAAKPAEHVVHNLEISLKDLHLGETAALQLAATVQPLGLPVKLDGTFGPLVQELELKNFDFLLKLGNMTLALKGAFVDGLVHINASSPLVDTAALPVQLPLTKPVQIRDFHLTAEAPYPVKQGVAPLQMAEVTDLGLAVLLGKSTVIVTGTVSDGHAKIALTSPSVNTADLPVSVPLKKPVAITDFSMKAEMRGQDVRVASLTFRLFDGVVNAGGGLTLAPHGLPFTGTATLHGFQLGPALETLGMDQISISGIAAANLSLKGQGFSMPELTTWLQGTGHVAVKDGRLEGVNLMEEALRLLNAIGVRPDAAKATVFSTIETDVAINRGIVNVHRLLMDSHDFQATGAGTVGFDQRLNLKADLRLSQALSESAVGKAPAAKLAMSGGRLSLPLLIRGTVQAPSYALDTKVFGAKVQEQVKQKVEQAIGDALKGKTRPQDLEKQGKDLLRDLLGR